MTDTLRTKANSLLNWLDACWQRSIETIETTESTDQYYHLQYVNRYTCMF